MLAGSPSKDVKVYFSGTNLISVWKSWWRRLKQERRGTGGRSIFNILANIFRILWCQDPNQNLLSFPQTATEAGVQGVAWRPLRRGVLTFRAARRSPPGCDGGDHLADAGHQVAGLSWPVNKRLPTPQRCSQSIFSFNFSRWASWTTSNVPTWDMLTKRDSNYAMPLLCLHLYFVLQLL